MKESAYLVDKSINPYSILKTSSEKLKFQCPTCPHLIEKDPGHIRRGQFCEYCRPKYGTNKKPINNYKICDESENCDFCKPRTFGSHDKAKYLTDKNLNPYKISLGESQHYNFTCDKCSHCFDATIQKIVGEETWCPYCPENGKLCRECDTCFKKSLANHKNKEGFILKVSFIEETDSFIEEKDWVDIENNPRYIKPFTKSNTTRNKDDNEEKYLYGCDKCKHDCIWKKSICQNTGCIYCTHQALCDDEKKCEYCYQASFASTKYVNTFMVEKNKISPRFIFKNSCHIKYWFKCPDLFCNHEIELFPSQVSEDNFPCGYCSSPPKHLCDSDNCENCYQNSFASHPRANEWSDKNTKTPREVFKGTPNKYLFKCSRCSHEYRVSCSGVNGGSGCPKCKNKTEKNVLDWLCSNHEDSDILHQAKFDWCKNDETKRHLPFDICIKSLKFIIEIDGRQHFEVIKYWKNNPDNNRKRDIYKMNCAIENGYKIIRIIQEDIYNNKYDWKKKLNEIINNFTDLDDKVFYVCENNEYNSYITERELFYGVEDIEYNENEEEYK